MFKVTATSSVTKEEVSGDYAIVDGVAYIFSAYGFTKSCSCCDACDCPQDAIEAGSGFTEVDPESLVLSPI